MIGALRPELHLIHGNLKFYCGFVPPASSVAGPKFLPSNIPKQIRRRNSSALKRRFHVAHPDVAPICTDGDSNESWLFSTESAA